VLRVRIQVGAPVLLLTAWALCTCASGADPVPPAPAGDAAASLVYERTLEGNDEICIVPKGGGQERRIASHPARDRYPRWTPDGRSIVFSSERSGSWQLWEAPADGGEPRRLEAGAGRRWQSDPSPDGTRLVFVGDEAAADFLGILQRGSGRVSALLRHGGRARFGNADWSPDGRRITFSSNRGVGGHRVYVADVATGQDELISGLLHGGCEPRFSPDGRRVAHVRGGFLRRGRNEIVERDLATGKERVLVGWPARNYDPVYSPDGTELAFVSTIGGEDFALYRLRLADASAWRVSFGPGPVRHPDYRPVP
jgi:Tol biopolymer transport system component